LHCVSTRSAYPTRCLRWISTTCRYWELAATDRTIRYKEGSRDLSTVHQAIVYGPEMHRDTSKDTMNHLPLSALDLGSPLVLNIHIRPSRSSIQFPTSPTSSRIHFRRNLIFDEFTSSCDFELEDTLVLHYQLIVHPDVDSLPFDVELLYGFSDLP
jgi:hypothetical protein